MTKNPLTMIGLTPAILGLGLTQDELYEYCTRIARTLFACVHPDRHNGTQRPEALRFSEAFALLKDRQVFHAALKEFQGSAARALLLARAGATRRNAAPALSGTATTQRSADGRREKTPRTRPTSRKSQRDSPASRAKIRSIPHQP